MNNYKLVKLDRRYNGFAQYSYMAEPVWNKHKVSRQAAFLEWREWAWSTFGPGCELELISNMAVKPQWAWTTEFDHLRIYLTDESLTLFKLRW